MLGLGPVAPTLLYGFAIAAWLLSVFWRPIIGIYFLIPLLPLQTVRYWINDYPLGASLVDVILLGVVLGFLRRHVPIFGPTPARGVLFVFFLYSYLSLWIGAFYLNTRLPIWPADPRVIDWKDYMTMPLLFFLVVALRCDVGQMKRIVLLMCVGTLLLDRSFHDATVGRDFSKYSHEVREEGAMGYAGVNGLAAFEAQAAVLLLALASFEKRTAWKLGYFSLAGFSINCLMFAFSRAGYIAFVLGWFFLGIMRQRILLVLLAIFLVTWQTVVPEAVQERILMTYNGYGGYDHSAELRLSLWDEALTIFDTNPVLGTGLNTYAYGRHVGSYQDTHNYYIKVLIEGGIVGLLLLLTLLGRAFALGCVLVRNASDPFVASIGLGLAGWVVAALGANFFGDRWTYLQVSGYFWILMALAAQGYMTARNHRIEEVKFCQAA